MDLSLAIDENSKGEPSVSFRRHITWLPDNHPAEPTITLVLTSSRSFFVDVRITRQTNHLPILSSSEFLKEIEQDKARDLSRASIDWAFAGTRSRVPNRSTGMIEGVWRHWIDSRTFEAEKVSDYGEMIDVNDDQGNVLYELEKGNMVGPSGSLQNYEEAWVDIELPTENTKQDARSLQQGASASSPSRPGTRVCIVLMTAADRPPGTDPSQFPKSMIIRVDNFIQGVFRHGDEFAVERWYRKIEGDPWMKLVQIGRNFTPCERLFADEIIDAPLLSKVYKDELEFLVAENVKF